MPGVALSFKVSVEGVPIGEAGDRHRVVAAGVADHPFNVAFVIPLAGAPMAVADLNC